jgi:hypothetical protein
VPYRLQVNSRRLHGDVGAAFGRQPIRQGDKILGRRLERFDLSLDGAARHVADGGDHRVLANVKPSAMRVQNFHLLLLGRRRLGTPVKEI